MGMKCIVTSHEDNEESRIIKAFSVTLLMGCFILAGFLAFQWDARQVKSVSEPGPGSRTQHQVLDAQGGGETVRLSEAGGNVQAFFAVPADAQAMTNESGQVIAQRWVSDGVQRDVEQTFNADGEVIQTRKYLNGKLIEEVF